MIDLARRWPLVAFFGLACVLSWWPWLWHRFDPAAFATPIFTVGPLVAALVMLLLAGGWSKVRAFLARVVRWRVHAGWYAFALLVPPAITAMAFGTNLFLGAPLPADAALPGRGELVVRFAVIFLLAGLGEEPAWRGYALPKLMEGRTALAAALILGVLQAIWHLPLLGIDYDLGNLGPWLVSVLAMSVVAAWLALGSGSLLLPALMHAAADTSAFVWTWFGGADQLRLWWIWAVLWLAVAAIVGLATAPGLVASKPRRMMR